ncbi:PPOX class F420-dependent oxidoreductase [Nocardia cyriacigeorgica]|uniref:PPOX class F420-dependent oxidoreductase n=1 Tax=Nocardia cyriacigeorgica TaxID=135487 RepID=UPI0024550B15|nr:PPOX class F420-dependent oxidoreductase [Nocardia cyriacigeorgica]
MGILTDVERDYLHTVRLCRLSTVTPDGQPMTVPLSFRLNDDDTIDIGGPNHANTRRFRNVLANPKVSVLFDDMTPDRPGELVPGKGRGIEIRGVAETLTVDVPPVAPDWFSNDIIRIHPRRVHSWHIDAADPPGRARTVA